MRIALPCLAGACIAFIIHSVTYPTPPHLHTSPSPLPFAFFLFSPSSICHLSRLAFAGITFIDFPFLVRFPLQASSAYWAASCLPRPLLNLCRLPFPFPVSCPHPPNFLVAPFPYFWSPHHHLHVAERVEPTLITPRPGPPPPSRLFHRLTSISTEACFFYPFSPLPHPK